MQREKLIYSGPLLEADFYPIYSDGRKMPTRAPKTKLSSAEQQKYNKKQAIKKFVRLVNANFDKSDYLLHPTYEPKYAPKDEERAKADISNYIRRVKRRRASESKKLKAELLEVKEIIEKIGENKFLKERQQNLKNRIKKLDKPFKYTCRIEKQVYKSGKYAGLVNWHFHLFMTGGLPNKMLEDMWSEGMRTNCNNYQPERFGPEAAARYMGKDMQNGTRLLCSKNLARPKEKKRDGKISRRQVEAMSKIRVDDAEYWEKRYKGYRFLRCYPRYNEYNGHYYLSVVMYKSNGSPPKWEENDWLTEDY